ncbi:IgGFc-binding protein-like [Ambystoma mexicanum]|uniref:IgGFc-binding protein-like n=1 Tax=Ambystoma mexicanum TaxID=8296 RepID=UPI0037E8FDB2
MIKSCRTNSQLPSFSVEAKNQNRGNTRFSYVTFVTARINEYNITMKATEPQRVTVNGKLSGLPISLDNGNILISTSGEMGVIKFGFGMNVLFDFLHYLRIELMGRYTESVCGLCGNNNKNSSDDFATPAGTQAPNSIKLAESWKVEDGDHYCWHDCNGLCEICPPHYIKRYNSQDFCGLIAKAIHAAFSQCHEKIPPKSYLDSCVYDVCLNGGDKQTACQSLKVYAIACQREGVVIGDWRKEANCPLECGANSQYTLCGTACPNTCDDDSASTKCSDPCLEGCECNAGYVLTLGKCVPKETCGCTYKGFPYAQNEVFWDDDKCQTQCTCNPASKKVECRAAQCKPSEKCSTVNGVRGCYPVSYCKCSASADPHYSTCDQLKFDFQGNCAYQFSGLCNKTSGQPDYQVIVHNEHRGQKTVTFTKKVEIHFNGNEIVMGKEFSGKVKMNSHCINLPYTTADNTMSIYNSGRDIVVETYNGIKVTFDCKSRITATIPSTYAGAICGLCGDYNGDKTNDLTLKNGEKASNPTAFGDSWQVRENPGCRATEPTPPCPQLQTMTEQQRSSGKDCGVLLGKEGPFRDCHSKVNPDDYFDDCIYDSCYLKGRQAIFCQTLESYATDCQAAGATLYAWRTETFCAMSCPENSHYELCADPCPVTCSGRATTTSCDQSCTEGCACNNGFVFSGDQCVSRSQCGCVHMGQYYKRDEVFYPDDKCNDQCTCKEAGYVTCTAFSCGPNEECSLVDGIQSCHPVGYGTCNAIGDHHCHTLDGYHYDFQGGCIYTLAKPCGGNKNLTDFAVNVKNGKFVNGQGTVPVRVTLEVYGHTFTLTHQKSGVILVSIETTCSHDHTGIEVTL